MSAPFRPMATIALTGLWINASEFVRNEWLLKSYWETHYQSLGLVFPSAPINGLVWVGWGFLFATVVYWMTRRFDLIQAALIGWLMAFVSMWLVLGNLHVLPQGILLYAIPLSLVEVFVATWLCRRLSPPCATC